MSLYDDLGVAPPAPTGDLYSQLGVQPPQMGGVERPVAFAASNLAKGAAKDLGIPGNLLDLYSKHIGMPVSNAISSLYGGQQQTEPLHLLPNSQDIEGAGQSAGLWNRPDLQTQSTWGKYAGKALEGAGGALPFAPMMGASALENAVASGIGGASANSAASVAENNYPKNWPGHDYAPFIASLIGGSLGGKGVNLASRVGGAPNDTLKAWNDVGLQPKSLGFISDDPGVQETQAFSAKIPGGGKATQAMRDDINAYGSRVMQEADNIAPTLAATGKPVTTLQEAGLKAQEDARSWLDQFKTKQSQTWSALEGMIPPSTSTDITPYHNILKEITEVPASVQPLIPSTASNLKKGLEDQLGVDKNFFDLGPGTVPLPIATGGPNPIPWKDVAALKTRIGEKLSDPNLPSDTAAATLKRLYGALSVGQANTVDALDAASGSNGAIRGAFNQANAQTVAGHQVIDRVITPILKDGAVPEKVMNSWLNSGSYGGTTLQTVRDEMPQTADAMASVTLRRALGGEDQTGAGVVEAPTDGAKYSPVGLDSVVRKISPEANQALFGSNAAIPALAKMSAGMRGVYETPAAGAVRQSATSLFARLRDAGIGAGGGMLAGHEFFGGNPSAVAGLGAGGAAIGAMKPGLEGWLGAQKVATPWLTNIMGRQPTVSNNVNIGGMPFGMALPSILQRAGGQ